MIILHAGELDGSLALWAESDDARRTARRAARERGLHGASAHPHALGLPELRSVLTVMLRRASAEAVEARRSGKAISPSLQRWRLASTAAEVLAWLPSSASAPYASDGAEAAMPALARDARITPWAVRALILPAESAVRLISGIAPGRMRAGEVAIGSGLAYWLAVLRHAASMVARGRFIPGMDAAPDGSIRAVWQPVIAGGDFEELAELTRNMNAAARSLTRRNAAVAPSEPPQGVLTRVLWPVIDHMVRAAAAAKAPPHRMPSKRSRAPVAAGGYRPPPRRHVSIHDAWIDALRRPDGRMDTDPGQALRHAERMNEWYEPIMNPKGPDLVFCFRLEEPKQRGDGDGAWFLRYLVRPRGDPKRLVAGRDAWNGDKEAAAALGVSREDCRMFMVESVIRAAEISDVLTHAADSVEGREIDTDAAYDFLVSAAPELERAGYGIILPEWWTKSRPALSARARAMPQAGSRGELSLESLASVRWDLALGDQSVTEDELRRLADEKAPLVRVHGRWVEANPDEIRRAVEFLGKRSSATLRELVMMELGSAVPEGLDLEVDSADRRISQMMSRLRGSSAMDEIAQPDGFVGTLRAYQLRGLSWMEFLRRCGLGGCLADDMGLGKTIQVLALAEHYRGSRSRSRRPFLLVCPTSVIGNWQREAARFVPSLRVMMHHGAGRAARADFAKHARRHDMVVTSYALMHRDSELLGGVRWGAVVLDEAQNIKNPDTKQARAARSLDSDWRVALTGTPVENSVADLWSIMEFLNPSLLGTRASFRRAFFTPIQAGERGALEQLKSVTGPFVLRRLKTDESVIADLPEKMEMNVYCQLTKEQASLYAAVLRDVEEKIGAQSGIARSGLVLATLTALKQVCNHPAHYLRDGSRLPGRSGKLARLTEMLEEVMASGESALVFTQFVEMGRLLSSHLADALGRDAPFLHGGTTRRQRDAMVKRFQDGDGGGARVLIVSLKAGGTGLNLTAASHVFHFDRWWNPAVENQATDRAHRIGQERRVQVHKLVCVGTMEERIDEIIKRKRQVSEETVGSGEGWLTKLSNDELRRVIALGSEAAS